MPQMFHLSLNVSDLPRAVEFYTKALGVPPAKAHPDYAKFELSDPPLVLSLEPGRAEGQDRLNHLGIRVPDGNALRAFAEKAHIAGLTPQYLQGVECCYSRQTKLCLNDPEGNLVEFYILEADLEKSTSPAGKTTDAPAVTAKVIFEHLLGSPFPAHLEYRDGSVNEVRLRGTFNIRRTPQEISSLLREARRVLKQEGELMIHQLVSNKPIEKALPKLPGPAALVEYTPSETELVRQLEEAGFTAVTLKRLSHSPVFQFDGAEMRELMLTANPKRASHSPNESWVVYKGPFREITDDHGVKYIRGNRTAVKAEVFATLQTSALAENFVFLN